MAKKRKQSWGAFPVMASVPTGEVEIRNSEYEEPAALRARLRREEAEAREAPVKAAIAQLNQTMLELRAAKADALFKIPSEELASVTTATPDNVEGTVAEIRAQIKAALDTALTELERTGVTIHDSGKEKMKAVSRLNLSVDWRIHSNWTKLYELMSAGGLAVFTDEDATVPRSVEDAPAPAPRATLDELLETTSAESYEGRRKLIAAVSDFAELELAPLAAEWIRHIGVTHGIYPTESEMKKVVEFFRYQNLSWSDRRSFDRARKFMILVEKAWPLSALSDIERLELETRFPPSHCASFRAERIAAIIPMTRFLPSSIAAC